ncbi:MAG: Hsp20/alpha crystallin family protein [Sedimentisphaerales bacterium]|nr:Hsp20/alpha crystallin family protein [Sedimentisphaerales bacterium]
MLPILKQYGLRRIRPQEHFNLLNSMIEDFLPEVSACVPVGRLDMYEDEQNLYVEAELPGFSRDQIKLTLEDGTLHLEADRAEGEDEAKQNYYIRERSFGKWYRTISLPVAVQQDEVAAGFENGVLKITLAKQQQKKSQQIEIK